MGLDQDVRDDDLTGGGVLVARVRVGADVKPRPAVKASVFHRGRVIGRQIVAQSVAFVDHAPEGADGGLDRLTRAIAQAGGEDAALTRRQIQFVDRRPALLGRHAVVADVGLRTYAGIQLPPIGTRQQTARPAPFNARFTWSLAEKERGIRVAF